MVKRTTIVLPPELKERAMKRAKNQGLSLSGIIRESLRRVLESPVKSRKKDTLFADKATFKGPRDLAKNHDKYLYGE